jgi:hypothetical protein
MNTGKVVEDGADPIGDGGSDIAVPPGLPNDPLDQPNLTHDFAILVGRPTWGKYIVSRVLLMGYWVGPSKSAS